MNLLKAIGGGLAVTVIWLLATAFACVVSAMPIALGLTLIALFGRSIGAF